MNILDTNVYVIEEIMQLLDINNDNYLFVTHLTNYI